MTPKDLIQYLNDTLDCEALRRLDQASLYKLQNLLHHWYMMVQDTRRKKAAAAAATASQLARAADPGPDPFTLHPAAGTPPAPAAPLWPRRRSGGPHATP